jgi:hypothetical protein
VLLGFVLEGVAEPVRVVGRSSPGGGRPMDGGRRLGVLLVGLYSSRYAVIGESHGGGATAGLSFLPPAGPPAGLGWAGETTVTGRDDMSLCRSTCSPVTGPSAT